MRGRSHSGRPSPDRSSHPDVSINGISGHRFWTRRSGQGLSGPNILDTISQLAIAGAGVIGEPLPRVDPHRAPADTSPGRGRGIPDPWCLASPGLQRSRAVVFRPAEVAAISRRGVLPRRALGRSASSRSRPIAGEASHAGDVRSGRRSSAPRSADHSSTIRAPPASLRAAEREPRAPSARRSACRIALGPVLRARRDRESWRT